jgi:hypothetical protein
MDSVLNGFINYLVRKKRWQRILLRRIKEMYLNF